MGVGFLGCVCVCLVVWVFFLSWVCFQGDFRKQSLQFPVVDRPCLVLVRHCRKKTEVYVRGFSAGSYSGICLLHLLWNMPHVQVGGILGGISCPPALIHGISPEHGQSIMLIHLTTDRLCQWHPYDKTLHSLNCKYCIVDRKTQELKELFGSCEHSYGHWIDISLPHGRYPLYQLLRRFSDVAPPQARDIAPLRLVSSLSCEVPDQRPTGAKPADGAVWSCSPCVF